MNKIDSNFKAKSTFTAELTKICKVGESMQIFDEELDGKVLESICNQVGAKKPDLADQVKPSFCQ